jgi:hypothetical protein
MRRVLLIVVPVLLLALLVWPGFVQGHSGCVTHPAGTNVACMSSDDRSGNACDRVSDGNRVRANYEFGEIGDQIIHGNWDPNGANSGCSIDLFPASGWPRHPEWQRVCVENQGCSAWIHHP